MLQQIPASSPDFPRGRVGARRPRSVEVLEQVEGLCVSSAAAVELQERDLVPIPSIPIPWVRSDLFRRAAAMRGLGMRSLLDV